MKDQYQRNIDYLRISVTDRCNLRCVYCMPEAGVCSLAHEEVLTFEEILRLCRIGTALGIKKIKLTGGEPLVRKDLPRLVEGLKALDGIENVTLTTNGILLKDQMEALAEAGLDGVNISLDTTDEALYEKITRRPYLNAALEGIRTALSYPHIRAKINCVPMNTESAPQNILSVAELAKTLPIHVRFIEMMPIGFGKAFEYYGEAHILEILGRVYSGITPCEETLGNGPSHYYHIPGFMGKIGFISAMSHKFCHSCNRVRLTASGFLKTCLQYDTGTDLKQLLRGGTDDERLALAMEQAVFHKPLCHAFETEAVGEKQIKDTLETKAMFQIGG